MSTQANQLRQAVEQRKDYLINELLRYGYYDTADGR